VFTSLHDAVVGTVQLTDVHVLVLKKAVVGPKKHVYDFLGCKRNFYLEIITVK
jgi:hypothetical protein